MSLTTKTPEHAVLAYNLPRGRAVDRGKVAEETIAQAEAPHAAQPAEAAEAEADADDGLVLREQLGRIKRLESPGRRFARPRLRREAERKRP